MPTHLVLLCFTEPWK